ncbi:hypothetical protein FPV67DRAFT_1677172 [Lyophyllum atratum]|nr:hypothetical protein FPV67DRAFT_1677172 [Lyophyllum atratum]
MDEMMRARDDPRTVKLRELISATFRMVVDIWSTDAGISNVGLFSISPFTWLNQLTRHLITLPAGPLVELVWLATKRRLTAAWSLLAAILITQLSPPRPVLLEGPNIELGPTPEAKSLVRGALPILLECFLNAMVAPGSMEGDPDTVQEFFVCMHRVAQDLTWSFSTLPPVALDVLANCAITAVSLQGAMSPAGGPAPPAPHATRLV